MQSLRQSDFLVLSRSRKLVERSQAVLAASRRAVPVRWLSPVDRAPDDHLLELLAQLEALDEQE